MIFGMSSRFLTVQDVRKKYGAHEALGGVSFAVAKGELFGLLGPNGAGKSTLLSIIAGLSDATSGEVQFDGRPLNRSARLMRREIGIGTQDLAVYGELTARENLSFFGKLYGLKGQYLRDRIGVVLESIGLVDRADDRTSTFSGGMKRRLNLGVAIIHEPRLLLLDEPTTGVDPQSRNHIFERVRQLNSAGLTIIYTSHYMEEVQTLCPRIGILDHGRVIACDSRADLLKILGGTITLTVVKEPSATAERLAAVPGLCVDSTIGNTITLVGNDVVAALPAVVNALREANVEITELRTQEPKLEEVFLHLTKRTLRD